MTEGQAEIRQDAETTGGAPSGPPSPQAASLEEATVDDGRNTTEQVDEVQTLREELAAAQREAVENQDKFMRARADMENYKKRVERTYADLARSRKKDLLLKLLGVKDNLERALHYGENSEGNGEGIMEGVRLTQYQLDQLLAQEGVKPIESVGQPFDPRKQEAVQTVDNPNVPDHTVVQEVRKGYIFVDQDEVLRPAQVIVSVHQDET